MHLLMYYEEVFQIHCSKAFVFKYFKCIYASLAIRDVNKYWTYRDNDQTFKDMDSDGH